MLQVFIEGPVFRGIASRILTPVFKGLLPPTILSKLGEMSEGVLSISNAVLMTRLLSPPTVTGLLNLKLAVHILVMVN